MIDRRLSESCILDAAVTALFDTPTRAYRAASNG